jgi:hypothetical protein
MMHMLAAFAVSLLAILPQNDVACDMVDLIELNHVHDDQGRFIYTQLVFYDWRPQQAEYQVRSSRLWRAAHGRPEHDFHRNEWVTIFVDGELLREVRAAAFRETWTQYDVEQAERLRLPKEYRAGLLYERRP